MAPPAPSSTQTAADRTFLAGQYFAHPDPDEEIVITGISGSFPNAKNAYDFRDSLMNKEDLVSGDNRRWDIKHPEIPERAGRIYSIEKFDAGFFGIHYKQAQTMDPMGRILLEKTFEAIVDAGLHPSELVGTRTGVFIGASFSESEKTWFYEHLQPHGFAITGCIRSMLANRISYYLGVDGPSYVVDTACSSSFYAMDNAYRALRMGECDYAIVAASNLCLHPYVTLQFARLGVLNNDGRCKCFDESADGYTRSEAIVCAVLQKRKTARRIYSRMVHCKTNCDGFKPEGITFPSRNMQTLLMTELYAECGVSPSEIGYIEAHGTGTKVGDPEEISAIENVFCTEERKASLPIGSVKSNIGHAEPASGMCSLAKVILGMESDYLIPNINFTQARKEFTALTNGKLRVVIEKEKWDGGYIAMSSFGFGGANAHVLLKSHEKLKVNKSLPKDDLPRLIYVSGRTEEAINTIVDDIAKRPLDAEYIGLLHEVFKFDISAHIYRGYAILTKEKLMTREAEYYPYEDKQLWFVFSGLGSHWVGMGAQLMQIPIFAATVEKCHQILSKKGVNILDIITSNDASIHSKLTNVLVGTVVMQIALVDFFTTIDIKPVGFIGHSIGEIAAAYYDGCLTLQQAVSCAYYLGQASDRCKNHGSVVSVNFKHEKINELLLPGIEVASINEEGNCFVSGPTNKIQQFIKILQERNVEFKEINTNNLPYHSSCVKDIAASVLKHLKELVTTPKERSEKWYSSSKHTKKQRSKLCSAEFLSHILVTAINFEETYSVVPHNAITVEISPHGLLQPVLRRSVFDDSINIAALEMDSNGTEAVLAAVGKLYMSGLNPRIERIYPSISFPVSKSTPMLSPLIKWDHTQNWSVTKFEIQDKIKSGERTVTVKLNDDEQEFLAGHVIDGRILYPATGYLQLVWETVGMVRGQMYSELSVVFENVKFHRATNIPKEARVYLIIMVQKVSGNFEVIEDGSAIVTGRVFITDDNTNEMMEHQIPLLETRDDFKPLNSRDIYKELRLRGYNYSGLFRGLKSCDTTATIGHVYWKNNWVSFMDTVLQMQILQEDTRGLFVPTSIQHLSINTKKHQQAIENLSEDGTIPVYVYKNIKTIVSGGVEIRGLDASAIGRRKLMGEPVLETYKFLPNVMKTGLTLAQSVRVFCHIVIDNISNNKVKTIEVLDDNMPEDSCILSTIIQQALEDLPLKQADLNILTSKPLELPNINIFDRKLVSETNCTIVIVSNIFQRPQVLQAALNALIKDGFILTREPLNTDLSELDLSKIEIIADHTVGSERLILLTKSTELNVKTCVNLSDTDNTFDWVPILQTSLAADPNLLIYSEGDEFSGIIGFVNCLRKEQGTDTCRCVYIMDKDAPKFDVNADFYAKQLKKGLAINVLKNGEWGTYRHMLFEKIEMIKVEHAYVNVTVRGDLSSLRWLQGNLSAENELSSNQVLVYNYYSAMNFRDIMTATGRIAPEVVAKGRFAQECVLGLEFSGRLSNGRRVFGMLPHKSTATLIAADSQLMWFVPDYWSLEDAMTIPVVYSTVLYAMLYEGKMKPGMSVLIHCGTGGIGQAAIITALYYGCTVYTTVGTAAKREFIKENWPQIKDNQIGNSRDTSFEQMVMIETKGRGVDLVLNSLAEEKLLASIRCLAHGGKFLEIGKFDLSKDNPLPMSMFLKETSFHGIMLDTFFTTSNNLKKILFTMVEENIKNGCIKPIHKCVFGHDQIEEMFRYMAAGKHMGKVLLKIREEEQEKVHVPSKMLIDAVPRYFSSIDGSSYIITGGLGGFGLELTDWLIIRGAKNVILTSRKGITTGYQAMRVKTWKSYGVNLVISTDDVTTYDGCKKIIEQAVELGPVEAIFNLAVVLRDQIFENQTKEDFVISFGPKAVATKYLDDISRQLCPALKQFVVFSSVSCGRGNAGQTNYGMSNSVMERICENRKKDGLPALAIEWGAVGDVGLVAEMQEEHTDVVIGGTLQQRISNCLLMMDQFLRQDQPLVASMLVAEKRAGDGAGNIVDSVVNILGIRDIRTVSAHSSLAELGMDSIMAVEIKQMLEREFEVFLTPQDIRNMTFTRLNELADAAESGEGAAPEKEETERTEDMGMHFLKRAIGEEHSTSLPYIILPSKATPKTEEYAILIPGMEGMASVLETLASRMTAHAFCFQLGFKNEAKTIQEMAELFLDRVISNIPNWKSGFTIVAYSYGSTIALELAALLEKLGSVGRLIIIDGSPDMMRVICNYYIPVNEERALQNQVLSIIFNRVTSADVANQAKPLYENLESFDEKITVVLQFKPTDTGYTDEHYKNVIIAIYTRLKAGLIYKPEFPMLKSTIKLIKPTQSTVQSEEEDVGLSQYTSNPVEIVYVEGNHVLLVESKDTTDEINKVFQSDNIVLKEFVISEIENVKQKTVSM